MKRIPLGRSRAHALVDDEDYELVKDFKWHLSVAGINHYACRRYFEIVNGERRCRKIYLHRMIMNATDKKVFIDHRDGNGLNCTRANLRECDAALNARNRVKAPSETATRYKGVTQNHGRYRATISINGAVKYLGSFKTASDAARAYDEAAIKHFGEYAKPNFANSWRKYTA